MTSTIVVGSGKTSRANIEALMSDYYTANKNVTVYLYTTSDELSEAQFYIQEHAESLDIPVQYTSQYPKFEDADLLILWNDADLLSLEALQMAKKRNWPAYDLVDGLCSIPYPVEDIDVPEPNFPEEEQILEDVEEEVDELYDAFLVVAEYIADLVAEKMRGRRK